MYSSLSDYLKWIFFPNFVGYSKWNTLNEKNNNNTINIVWFKY